LDPRQKEDPTAAAGGPLLGRLPGGTRPRRRRGDARGLGHGIDVDPGGQPLEALHDPEGVGGVRVDVPGGRFLRSELDEVELRWAELSGSRPQPVHERGGVDHGGGAVLRISTVGDRASIEHRDDWPDGDRKSGLDGEPTSNVVTVPGGRTEVPRVRVVEAEHVIADPDGGAGVVLGVDGEDAARADDQVVDILRVGADRDRVPDEPLRPESVEQAADLDLAQSTLEPRPGVRVKARARGRRKRRVRALRFRLYLETLRRDGIAGRA